MFKKIIIPFFLALFLGVNIGFFLYKQYDNNESINISFMNNESKKVYFLQTAVYSNKEIMEKNLTTTPYYIYQVDNDKYYVYVAITSNYENALKLKDFFINNGYNIYIKQLALTNKKFLDSLDKYDELLSKISVENYGNICGQILKKYEEEVILEHND